MANKYVYVADIWEGQGPIDEIIMYNGGVKGFIIRLNDMNGGHHKDTAFDQSWAETRNLLRMPYFVYNPWVSGTENFNWLLANCPPEARTVAVDIEVAYSAVSPQEYTNQVNQFLALASPRWGIKIYTGGGYLGLLSVWPKNYDYWFARWPSALYPTGVETWTWDKFSSVANTLDWNTWVGTGNPNAAKIGPVKLWQATGDRLILPGTNRILDVSLWNGTEAELAYWFGYTTSSLEDRVKYLETTVAQQGARITALENTMTQLLDYISSPLPRPT